MQKIEILLCEFCIKILKIGNDKIYKLLNLCINSIINIAWRKFRLRKGVNFYYKDVYEILYKKII